LARALKIFVVILIASVSAAAVTLALHWFPVSASPQQPDMRYTDFVSITLTALSIMITVLGLFAAALGVIGWTTIESKLKAHSVEYFKSQLEKEGPLRRELEQLFADIAYSGIEGLKGSSESGEDKPYHD
jgi:hypothetical protein